MQTDPIGYADSTNLYQYCGNNPVYWIDPYGLFGEGKRYGAPYWGHSDFPGGKYFDYNAEDRDPATQPFHWPDGTKRHFRNLSDVEKDLIIAIKDKCKKRFERLMHQGQDFFSHYNKGYRWVLGHAPVDLLSAYHYSPDYDSRAWSDAAKWTLDWVHQWEQATGENILKR